MGQTLQAAASCLPLVPRADPSLISAEYSSTAIPTVSVTNLTLADLTGDEQKMLNSGVGPSALVRRVMAVESGLATAAVAQATVRNY